VRPAGGAAASSDCCRGGGAADEAGAGADRRRGRRGGDAAREGGGRRVRPGRDGSRLFTASAVGLRRRRRGRGVRGAALAREGADQSVEQPADRPLHPGRRRSGAGDRLRLAGVPVYPARRAQSRRAGRHPKGRPPHEAVPACRHRRLPLQRRAAAPHLGHLRAYAAPVHARRISRFVKPGAAAVDGRRPLAGDRERPLLRRLASAPEAAGADRPIPGLDGHDESPISGRPS